MPGRAGEVSADRPSSRTRFRSILRQVRWDEADLCADVIGPYARAVGYSVAGLVVLSAIHGLLFEQLAPANPGDQPWRKGVAWGVIIRAMDWLFQEWFVCIALLVLRPRRQPIEQARP